MAEQPRSKFGGVPVEESAPASKFGGVPVEESPAQAPKPSPATDPLAGIRGTRALTKQEQGIDAEWSAAHPGLIERGVHAVLGPMANSATTLGRGLANLVKPKDETRRAALADTFEGGGGMALPFALPSMISRPIAALAGGLVGAGAQSGGRAIARATGASPDTERLVGDVTGAVAGPLASKGAGMLMKSPAPMLAKSALGINGRTEAYGATPGNAILEETTGIRPSTIESSARGRLTDLNAQLESKARASTTPASLTPARDIISGKSAKAAFANSEATPRELAPMTEQLTEPRPGFGGATTYPPGAHTPIAFTPQPSSVLGINGQPLPGKPLLTRGASPSPVLAPEQKPIDFLGMKRQFDKDFIRNWSPAANTKGALGVARQAYGAMGDEFERAVPDTAPLNQRIASLIPVAERARLTDMNAGMGERMLGRAGRPTGGLFPLLFGYHEGGIPGALAAIGGTEGVSSPEVKMIGARSLFGAGKGLQSPEAMKGAALLPLLRRASEARQ